jgi:ketosteroid isomerase-like protein
MVWFFDQIKGDPLPMATGSDPKETVLRFLDLMEKRDLAAARALLAEGFVMEFPGPVRPDSLEQLVQWAKTRYQFVLKHFEHVDVIESPDGRSVVYCTGTLQGQWTDGTPFQGIRFIDRFELQDQKLLRQSVWNDLALHIPSTS